MVVFNQPILWHIMKIYENYGLTISLYVLLQSSEIKKFLNYNLLKSDVDFDLSSGKFNIIKDNVEEWRKSGKYWRTYYD